MDTNKQSSDEDAQSKTTQKSDAKPDTTRLKTTGRAVSVMGSAFVTYILRQTHPADESGHKPGEK